MWNIFKKGIKKQTTKRDIIKNYIANKGFTIYNKLCIFDLQPFCYLQYYEKTDKYGNQMFFGMDVIYDRIENFGVYFICKNGMQEFLNFPNIQVQQNTESIIEYIESYFHRKYGWDNNLEK